MNVDANWAIIKDLKASRLFTEYYLCSLKIVLRVREPLHYTEATRDEGWVRAMQEEFDAPNKSGT